MSRRRIGAPRLLVLAVLLGVLALLVTGCDGGAAEAEATPIATAAASATPRADNSEASTFASVVPDWIEGLDAQSESHLRDPYNYFATWPTIEGYTLLGDEVYASIEVARETFEERIGPPVEGSPVVPELNIAFEFIVASGSVVGLRLDRYEFFGAGGANLATTLWFDTDAGRQLPATALLDGDAALREVADIAWQALHRDRPDLAGLDMLEDGTSPSEEHYDSMGFTPEGDLLIEFDEYQVGPGASGSPRVVIPKTIAEPLLSDFGRRALEQVIAPADDLSLPTPTPTQATIPTPTPEASGPDDGAVDCAQVACVALTFDDGPARPTERLLDILKKRESRATFFVVGANVPYGPELLARMVDEGHEVGSHTFNHRDLTKLAGDELHDQVEDANDAIEAAAGLRPRLLRPPYGAVNDEMAAAVGMPLVLWSVDPRDWADHDPTLIAQRVAADAHRGSIVLLHDIHETTVDAVPAILDDFARRGLTPVTVSELLGGGLVAGQTYRGG